MGCGSSLATNSMMCTGAAGPGTFSAIKEGVDGVFLGRFGHDVDNLKEVLSEVGGVKVV